MPSDSHLHGYSDPGHDAVLIARVLDGDTEAFGDLVRQHQTPLHRYAVSLVLDHDLAQDMVQDAFVRAYTRLRDCRDPSRFRPWLFQILRNRCLDHLKDTRRRHVSLDAGALLADGSDAPLAVVERRRLQEDVAQALMRLPAAQREAFLLHYVHDMPYEAMADLLDTSVSALKMRVLRAREALCATLRKEDVTSPAAVRLSIGPG
jgi:RNA polymerase sigma-70 factor (ECF subfamily)